MYLIGFVHLVQKASSFIELFSVIENGLFCYVVNKPVHQKSSDIVICNIKPLSFCF